MSKQLSDNNNKQIMKKIEIQTQSKEFCKAKYFDLSKNFFLSLLIFSFTIKCSKVLHMDTKYLC